MTGKVIITLMACALLLVSCNQPTKHTEKTGTHDDSEFGDLLRGNGMMQHNHNAELKKITVTEILNGQRYSYLKVTEGSQLYWIATIKDTFKIGEEYLMKEGIFKTDYYSSEFDRTFDEIYLVSFIGKETEPGSSSVSASMGVSESGESIATDISVKKGSIPISEIVSGMAGYNGKTVQVTGKVVKVNANILDRNWIHIKDGSKDDFDFVATSISGAPVGHTITLKGVIRKDKDFGAGYRYEVIMEDAVIVR